MNGAEDLCQLSFIYHPSIVETPCDDMHVVILVLGERYYAERIPPMVIRADYLASEDLE